MFTGDAEIVLVGYGIVGRILKAVTAEARAAGLKVGLLRPITLYPFPTAHFQRLAATAREFRRGGDEQRTDARRCAPGAEWRAAGRFLSRVGGNVPSHEEVLRFCAGVGEREPAWQPSRGPNV